MAGLSHEDLVNALERNPTKIFLFNCFCKFHKKLLTCTQSAISLAIDGENWYT